jgi:hypothetical protein
MFTAVVRLQVIPFPGILINGFLNYDKELTRAELFRRLLTQRRKAAKAQRFGIVLVVILFDFFYPANSGNYQQSSAKPRTCGGSSKSQVPSSKEIPNPKLQKRGRI